MDSITINLVAIIFFALLGFYIAWWIFKKEGIRWLNGGTMPHYFRTRTELNALRFVPHSIIAIDASNKIVYTNKKAEETFKYTKSEFQDREEKIDLIMTKDCFKKFEAYKIRDHFSDAIELEIDCITKEKQIIPVKITMGRWHDDSDDTEYLYAVIIRSILHQKINKENNQQLQAKIEATAKMWITAESVLKSGAWHFDLETNIVNYTPGFARIFNIPSGQRFTGTDLMLYVYPSDHKIVEDAILQSQATGKHYEIEYRVGQKNGTKDLVRCWGYPVLNENGVRVAIDGTLIVIKENVP